MTARRATKINAISSTLIAPCGMNCRLCRAYVRDRKACPGCRSEDSRKSKSCVTCRIKNCVIIVNGEAKYCFGCKSFPCTRLNRLDQRYRTKYCMSMIDNLNSIRKLGIGHFIKNERERWTCSECGRIVCVHKPQCLSCGQVAVEICQMSNGDPNEICVPALYLAAPYVSANLPL
jgi:hypothetical protein